MNDKIKKIVMSGEIYRIATVQSTKNEQSLDYKIYGLHQKKCKRALKKLSRYEKFHEYLDLVKLSGYNEKKQLISLYMDSKIMPFPMSLNFKIPRIKKVGSYNFYFNKGFLKGLRGQIDVQEVNGRCLFSSKAYWKGPKSKIPDTIFEIFSETVGELAMTRLFQVSKTL